MPLRDELNGYLRLPRAFFGVKEPETGIPDVGVLGVPYDLTSSHMPGCRFGPDAIRAATDSERSHSFPLTIGKGAMLTDDPLSKLITLEDIGDLEVMGRLPDAAQVDISEAAAKLAILNSSFLFLGGDHFITYPLLKGIKRASPGRYGIVYFDSHADFYEDYGGYSLSHATTLRRLVEEKVVGIEDVVAYDLRSALPEQKKAILGDNTLIPTFESFQESLNAVSERVDSLYVSIDLDVLRPSIQSSVSHPESGGPDVETLAGFIRACFATKKVRYADIVELNPLTDKSGLGAIAARDIVKEILTGFAFQKGLN
ncbi:MAG: arginase family protein [Candidatus Thorarchaeota archaeon]